MRINKFIAQATGKSRREADDMIKSGRVSIDGNIAILGAQAEEGSKVKIDGDVVGLQKYSYLALHKPIGYVCSRRSQDNAPTVYELLDDEQQNLKTVGRLDKNSSGIILLTNDGDFAQHMTHPKYAKEKIYFVTLDEDLSDTDIKRLNSGVKLEDGVSKLVVEAKDDGYQVTMCEGRNRQIRRTFEVLGYRVRSLHRTKFGHYYLGELEPGKTQNLAKS